MGGSLKFIGFSILICVIFVGFFFFYTSKSHKRIDSDDVKQEEKLDLITPTPFGRLEEDAGEEDEKVVLAKCIEDEKLGIKDISFTPGSLLVSFISSSSLEDAKKFIESFGLSYAKRDGLDETFEANKWLEVLVPRGEEIDWMCTLKMRQEVKGVILNRLFELHE